MDDYKSANNRIEEGLNQYIRPQTFPVAIKMLATQNEIPAKARRPYIQKGKKVAVCQGVGMSRKYGWIVAMGKEDMQCSLGAAPFGFFEDIEYFLDGNMAAGMYTAGLEEGRKQECQVERFNYGLYSHILTAPLAKADFMPDMIVVYGNPAQIMRLIQAALYFEGGAVESSAMGRLGCATIISVKKNGRCRYVVPGNGDRVFGMTQDHEMAFYIPAEKADQVMQGLQQTHNQGVRYPITSPLDIEATFPENYQRQMDIWRQKGEL